MRNARRLRCAPPTRRCATRQPMRTRMGLRTDLRSERKCRKAEPPGLSASSIRAETRVAADGRSRSMQLPETRPDSPATSRESAKGAKLAVLAPVLDDLAVIRQAARIDELDLAAQLGDVADRSD